MNLLLPTILSIVAIIVIGTPFTYYWFRWSDRWAESEKGRFGSKRKKDRGEVRVIKSDTNSATGADGER
ncbi:MAG: hypothetical protein Phyf2KO_22900 [Phycisphaerales bacterium]